MKCHARRTDTCKTIEVVKKKNFYHGQTKEAVSAAAYYMAVAGTEQSNVVE